MFNKKFSYNGFSFDSKEDFLQGIKFLKSKFTEKHHIENLFFLKDFFSKSDYISTKTSGSTGEQKEISIKKKFMINSAIKTGNYFSLTENSTVAICLPSKYISGKMMLVRSVVLGLNLLVLEPNNNPLEQLQRNIDFIAMTPMQFINSKQYYSKARNILLGGDAISRQLEDEILKLEGTSFFHSYGMTETVSHIAIRDIKKENFFKVLEKIKISTDENKCLLIQAEEISDRIIKTRDIVEIIDKDKFIFLGRFDNMINSGGIKTFPEELEYKLKDIIINNFFIFGVKDEILNQKIVLFIEGSNFELKELKDFLKKTFDKYRVPKEIFFLDKFIYTETKKINRKKTVEFFEKNS